jgi:hypothetical protein
MSALRDALDRLKDDTPSERLHFVSGTDGDFQTVPVAVTNAVPQGALLQGLAQMLDRLLSRRVRLVSGTVRPVDPTRGAGLSLAISKRDGRQDAQITIWERDYGIELASDDDLAARYACLALPAAVWLAYQPPFSSTKERLGTTDWRSYALFAVAERAQREGAIDAARRGYIAALDADACNLGAQLNLGGLWLYDNRADETPAARDARLRLARPCIDAVATNEELRGRPIWFCARYQQALVELTLRNSKGASAICADTDACLHQLSDSGMARFVANFDWPHYVLWQSARLTSGEEPKIAEVENRGWNSSSTMYNLACFYARRYAKLNDEDDRSRTIARLRAFLDRLGDEQRQRVARAGARADPALETLWTDKEFVAVTEEPPQPKPPGESTDLAIRAGRNRWALGWTLVRTSGSKATSPEPT